MSYNVGFKLAVCRTVSIDGGLRGWGLELYTLYSIYLLLGLIFFAAERTVCKIAGSAAQFPSD